MDVDPNHSLTSLTLMRQLRANPRDAAAWETFLQTYGPRIDAWCRKWQLQEADVQDVTQNILLKLARQFGRFEYNPAQSFRNWLRTVTENALKDFVETRTRKTIPTATMKLLTSMEAQADLRTRLSESFDLELLAEARRRVKDSVDEQHWTVFVSMVDNGLTGADAAQQFGVSVANAFAVKSRLQKKIREQIRKLDEGSDQRDTSSNL